MGFDAQIMRDAPFYAFFFGTYELNCYLFRTYIPTMPEELNYFLRSVDVFDLNDILPNQSANINITMFLTIF